jgi:DNA-binding CsgD family transcriptional regulator
MVLVERDSYLEKLLSITDTIAEGEGHSIFLSGEAGIGKTALVKAFCRAVKNSANIYLGYCDALFTPRPLAPLYDILLQLKDTTPAGGSPTPDRTALFADTFHVLKNQKGTTIIVFEDVHWADEATLDFIKFLARRITQLHCLFILTYRDNEIHASHSLRNVLGQLNADSFTRMQLPSLSKQVVKAMSAEKGFDGEMVYNISSGNPFYVNEILASYSLGIPDNIRDSILSVYNRLDDKTKDVLALLSAFPTALEVSCLELLEPASITALQSCIDSQILLLDNGRIFFKHELYRRTVESSLSPLVRINLNKRILATFRELFIRDGKIEQVIHHAKNANEYNLVVQYAPAAARQAVSVGAHTEASKLYLTAIEYYQGDDEDVLIDFYEPYAYECYLTNQIKEAIIYTAKSLTLRKKKDNIEKTGDNMRFLSRLWWWDGNHKKAMSFAEQAVDVLDNLPSSRAKAMAYSNMSHLKMLSDEPGDCIFWGEKAIAMAEELGDEEILSHALNNVGDVQIRIPSSKQRGVKLLQQSLDIALKNSYHEHVARAYTNMGHNWIIIKEYELAKNAMEAGIRYCEEKDLDSWTIYMLADKAKLLLETGNWNEALRIANNLVKDENLPSVVKIGAFTVLATIKMRKGEPDILPLLTEAKEKAFETLELQRIIPSLVALLEYEWITGKNFIDDGSLHTAVSMAARMGNIYENSEFAFWIKKAGRPPISLGNIHEGYDTGTVTKALKAAAFWERSVCRYEQALSLFDGTEEDKKKAIAIVHELGAEAVYEKMKFEMRGAGIRSIPRRARRTSTLSNPGQLTDREIEILQLLHKGLPNKEIANRLFISAKTVDHHISAILFKLEVNSRTKAVHEAEKLGILK